MIVVKMQGGLGNQMFQYAAALRLASHHNTNLRLDLSRLLDRSVSNATHRDFDLGLFGIVAELPTELELKRFRHLANPHSWTLGERVLRKLIRPHYYLEDIPDFHPEVLCLPNNTYIEGYFQDERNFSDVAPLVRERFRLAPADDSLSIEARQLADTIRLEGSCCIHVRRGDYITNPNALKVSGCCSLYYYRRSLDEIRQRAFVGKVFVFSDDVAWCEENFKTIDHLIVVSDRHAGDRASIHFWLMTLCEHFIISNSSFSWWAAWLGHKPGTIVCRPTPWFREPRFSNVEVCPPSWIALARD